MNAAARSDMRFSVIIPCHNAGPYIAEALQSVAGQELPPHEVIVIDDGSTDDTLAQVARSGVAVRVLTSTARNAAATRNIGMEAATGDWIAFLDADDIWYPIHLSRAAAILSRGDDVAFIANHHFLHAGGALTPIPPGLAHPLHEPAHGLPHTRFVELMDEGFHFGHSTVILSLPRLREVGFFDVSQKRRHDIDLWLRVLRRRTWAYDSEPHCAYRVDTPGSISRSVTNCEYFYLRALLRNRDGYETASMDRLTRTAARRGMGLAFVDDPPEFAAMRGLAWPHLTPRYRAFYRLAAVCPPPMRWAIRLKRRLADARRKRAAEA